MSSLLPRISAALLATGASAFVLVSNSGCFDSESTICDTGITCPTGTRCALNQPVCILDACGDGKMNDGEECDDGNVISGDGCSAVCRFEGCGNGIVDIALGEACDDGNSLDGDGCSADCRTNEKCGNGVVDSDLGEICDDGNNVSGDGCSSDCLSAEKCGNGYIDLLLGEECEPTLPLPVALSGVTCTSDCRYSGSGNSFDHEPYQTRQCRLTLRISVPGGRDEVPASLPARIVSDKGGIDCTPTDGGLCVSDVVPCGTTLTLALLPDDSELMTTDDMAASLNWGTEGCAGDGSEDGSGHPMWCSVTLEEDTPERLIEFSYGGDVPEGLCALSLNIVEGMHDVYTYPEGIETVTSEPLSFPGRIISSAGGINCTTAGGQCTSRPMPCGQSVILSWAVPASTESNLWEMTEYMSWGVPGCHPVKLSSDGQISLFFEEEGSGSMFACEVPLTHAGTQNITINYDGRSPGYRNACIASAETCGFPDIETCVADVNGKVSAQIAQNGATPLKDDPLCATRLDDLFSCLSTAGIPLTASDLCIRTDVGTAFSSNGELYRRFANACGFAFDSMNACLHGKEFH